MSGDAATFLIGLDDRVQSEAQSWKEKNLLIGFKLQREKFLNNISCLILDEDTNPPVSAKSLDVLFASRPNVWKQKILNM